MHHWMRTVVSAGWGAHNASGELTLMLHKQLNTPKEISVSYITKHKTHVGRGYSVQAHALQNTHFTRQTNQDTVLFDNRCETHEHTSMSKNVNFVCFTFIEFKKICKFIYGANFHCQSLWYTGTICVNVYNVCIYIQYVNIYVIVSLIKLTVLSMIFWFFNIQKKKSLDYLHECNINMIQSKFYW